MLWRSAIGEAGQEFVRTIMCEYSEVFKSLDIGIYFDDYVYVVREEAFLGRGTVILDKDHYEVTNIDAVPKEGWMKVIFWGLPPTINSLEKAYRPFGEVRHKGEFYGFVIMDNGNACKKYT